MDRILESSKSLVIIAIVSAALIAFSHFGGKD